MSTKVHIDVDLHNAITSLSKKEENVDLEPTEKELLTLKQTTEQIPLTAWLLILSQLCEGFIFFGTYTIFQNYIQFPIPNVGDTQPGALDRGRKTATTMTMTYFCLCNLSPIALAIISDQFWGKYKTICVTSFIYLLGLIILVVTSTPLSISRGIGLPGLICAMILLGIAGGGFRTMIGPFIAEQYTRKTLVVKDINGKKKIINPQMTIQSIFSWSYWATNAGSLISKFLTPTVEKYHSFWLAYLITLLISPVCIMVLLFMGRHRYIRVPPSGSLVLRGFHVICQAIKNRWKSGKQSNNEHILDYAKDDPISFNATETKELQNKNQFIDDLKQTFRACRVFLFFPFFWMCYNQAVANLISQAAQMNVGPIPNDILQTINPLVIVVFVPIFDKIFYPLLRKCNIKLNPIVRMTFGFVIAAFGIAWTAVVQYFIYSTGPNFTYGTKPCLTCQKFNNITVAWQIPSYFLLGIAEIFAAITGIEYAYINAPKSMKSIVMALFVCTRAFGSILNLSLVPVTVDPQILWMYVSLASATFIIAIIFYVVLREKKKQSFSIPEVIRRESILSISKIG